MITPQNAIANMMEDAPFSAGLMGSTSLVNPQSITLEMHPLSGDPHNDTSSNVYDQQNEPEFSQDELSAAATFIQMIGDVDKAKRLLDRCNECSDCLGLDQDDDFDTRTIESIAIEAPEYE